MRLINLFVGALTRLASTTHLAISLVHRAAPGRAAAVIGLHLLTAALLGAQVLLGREALDAVLAAQTGAAGVRAAVAPLASLAVAAAVGGFAAPALALQNRLLGELAQRAVHDRILAVTTSVPLRRFDEPAFADQLQRVRANAVARPLLVTTALMQLLGAAAAIGVLALALLALHPLLPPALLAAGLPLLLVSRRGGAAEFAFAVGQSPSARLRDHLRGVLTGHREAREVRAYALAGPLRSRYDRACDEHLAGLRTLVNRRHRQAAAASALTAVATAVTLVLLVAALLRGTLSMADAGAAVLAVKLLGTRLEQVFIAAGSLYESKLFLDDLHRFAAAAAEPAGGAEPATIAAPAGFAVLRAEGVGFRYPGAARPSLDGVDLTLRRGEVVGLVGENGSGKSTLAMLLAGLHAPDTGRIAWDGTDLAACDPASVREQVTVLFADPVRYALPAADNIAPGSFTTGTPHERAAIRHSARLAGAHDVIRALPGGYDTPLSSEYVAGTGLSDGQWQRIALARAFHRAAPLVILDEPATALDPRAEHELFETVRDLFAGRTVIVISHRLANVRTADRIVVLAGGRVAEEGDHDTLLAAGGHYATMFALQAGGYVPSGSP